MHRSPRPLLLAVLLAGLLAGPTPALSAGQDAAGLDAQALSGLRLRTIGPAAMSGRMVDVAVLEEDTYVFYVATATGGLWKTTDNGISFSPVFESQDVHSIGDVAVSQVDPEIVWVGTGERANRQSSSWGNGVYRSTDGGETWEHKGLTETRHVGRVVVHPDDPQTVFVAAMGHLWGANEERGLYRTRDAGDTWERMLYVDPDTGAVDVALDPEDPDIVYAATYQRRRTAFGFHGGGPGSGLYRSDDGGESWTELSGAAIDPDAPDNPDHPDGTLVNGLPAGDWGRVSISIHRADPRVVYASIELGLEYTASISYETERYAGTYRSDDRGLTWQHMSDWNPRPMYASQIAADPNDPDRVYHLNSFSYSEDGGRTWTVPSQTIHSDDRFVWIDPADSRHLIKASDGALGISYDRGESWRWAPNLPVSQFYRVSVDMRDPYNVYGGLQDNGTWYGPNETFRSEGVLNEDWIRIGGGDGFEALVDPEDPDLVYVESQYLGLARVNLETLESQWIRPGNPLGYEFGRRNWDLFGTGEEPGVLEQEMEPGNWDGPYILSPHDPSTVYAGTENLYVSRDRGDSWTDLGRMSDAWERSEVEIMGQPPTARTPSLDDGSPYFATLTTIAESPLRQGLLYVGTDDGNVRVSEDGGESWRDVEDRVPGLPARTWVADLAPSPHDPATVFAAFDNHREDDYANYLYVSRDRGGTWTSIVGDMPAHRVVRAVQQDRIDPELLYAATELGFFVSVDGGGHWVELGVAMPTVAVNDFAVHPRDDDLVLGTHGRGIWILDQVNALRELSPEVIGSEGWLFGIDPARMIRRTGTKARTGDTTFRGANPPNGAIIDYWLGAAWAEEPAEEEPDDGAPGQEPAADEETGSGEGRGETAAPEPDAAEESPVTLMVLDADGETVRRLEPGRRRGVNRVIWDLRHDSLPPPARIEEEPDPVRADLQDRERPDRAPSGPLVVPGTYTVRLQVGDVVRERSVEVREDPRIEMSAPARRTWTRRQLELGDLYVRADDLVAAAIEAGADMPEDEAEGAAEEDLVEFRSAAERLRTRILTLGRQIAGWTGSLTADQRRQWEHYVEILEQLETDWEGR